MRATAVRALEYGAVLGGGCRPVLQAESIPAAFQPFPVPQINVPGRHVRHLERFLKSQGCILLPPHSERGQQENDGDNNSFHTLFCRKSVRKAALS